MTEPLTTRTPPITRTDWLLVGLLVALVLPLRLWLLHNTEVTARDSIGYIRYARDFDYAHHEPPPGAPDHWPTDWKFVVNKYHQHPGYSVLVWLMSIPVREWDGGEMTPENMEYSAQLVNFCASLVLLLPMYFAGRQFFGYSTSFFGTLLYQYLPVSAQHLSDAISEPVFLVFLVSALLQAFQALRTRHPARCALCGVFTGLAYLTRPEGLLVLPAFCLVLIAMQCFAEHRSSWRQFATCGLTMILATAATGYIYYHATGKISNKPTVTIIRQQRFLSESTPKNEPATSVRGGQLFAVSFPETEHRGLRFAYSFWALCMEVNQGFHYVAGIPMLLGLWWSFAALRGDPAYWMIMTFGAVHGLILAALAMSVCYVSDRHVMILVLGWTYFAVYGMQELPRRLLAWRKVEAAEGWSWRGWHRSATVWFAIFFFAFIVFCLPKTTHRLHGNRAGNHEAGLWLSKHFQVGDHIEDDHNWSEYFAGFTFREYDRPVLPADHTPTCYIVTTRSRDPQVNKDRVADIGARARVVFVWPENSDLERARVVVYAQPRDRKKNPWHVAAP